MMKKLPLFLFMPLMLAGCNATFTNLTPLQQARNTNNVYPVEVALSEIRNTNRVAPLDP